MSEAQVTIERTSDYDKFQSIHGNRDVKDAHVERLAEEIVARDLTPYFPVLINENWEVIDGQHRLEVCRRLELPVYYIQAPGLDLTSVQRINTSTKRWQLIDYIESYIKQGKQEYLVLRDFSKLHGIGYSIGAATLMDVSSFNDDGTQGDSHQISFVIRNGHFNVVDLDKATQMVEILKTLNPSADFDTMKSRHLLFALNRLMSYELFSIDTLLDKLRTKRLTLNNQTTVRLFLVELERIYNKGSHNAIDFFTGLPVGKRDAA